MSIEKADLQDMGREEFKQSLDGLKSQIESEISKTESADMQAELQELMGSIEDLQAKNIDSKQDFEASKEKVLIVINRLEELNALETEGVVSETKSETKKLQKSVLKSKGLKNITEAQAQKAAVKGKKIAANRVEQDVQKIKKWPWPFNKLAEKA